MFGHEVQAWVRPQAFIPDLWAGQTAVHLIQQVRQRPRTRAEGALREHAMVRRPLCLESKRWQVIVLISRKLKSLKVPSLLASVRQCAGLRGHCEVPRQTCR